MTEHEYDERGMRVNPYGSRLSEAEAERRVRERNARTDAAVRERKKAEEAHRAEQERLARERADEVVEAHKRRLRAHWLGDDDDFARAWPKLRQEFLEREARAGLTRVEREMEALRSSGRYSV